MFAKVRGDELVAVWCRLQCDPDQTHLGPAVGIDCDEGGIGTFANELTCGVIEFPVLFYGLTWRFIPGRLPCDPAYLASDMMTVMPTV